MWVSAAILSCGVDKDTVQDVPDSDLWHKLGNVAGRTLGNGVGRTAGKYGAGRTGCTKRMAAGIKIIFVHLSSKFFGEHEL